MSFISFSLLKPKTYITLIFIYEWAQHVIWTWLLFHTIRHLRSCFCRFQREANTEEDGNVFAYTYTLKDEHFRLQEEAFDLFCGRSNIWDKALGLFEIYPSNNILMLDEGFIFIFSPYTIYK